MFTEIRNKITRFNMKAVKNHSIEWMWRVGVMKKHSWSEGSVSFSPSGMPGSGAGKGGGAGGAVRESGGGLGKYGAAQEEHYFFNKQKEQLEKIKDKLKTDKPDELAQKEEK